MIRTIICFGLLALAYSVPMSQQLSNLPQKVDIKYNYTFGVKNEFFSDEMVFQDVVKVARNVSSPFGVYETVSYPIFAFETLKSRQWITAIEVLDVNNELGVFSAIVDGGVGFKNATVKLYSEQSKGLYAVVKIYVIADWRA